MSSVSHITLAQKGKNLHMNVSVSVLLKKEGRMHIAYAPLLDLCTHGRSKKEAVKHFDEVVKIFFEEVVKMGTLEDVLSDLGWKRHDQAWGPPVEIQQTFALPVRHQLAVH